MILSVVLLLHKEVLVCAVCRECNGRNAQSWEGGLKAVKSGEWSGISPLLTVTRQSVYVQKRSSQIAHFLNHGSPRLSPAAAAKAFGSKPVRFGRAALLTLKANVSHEQFETLQLINIPCWIHCERISRPQSLCFVERFLLSMSSSRLASQKWLAKRKRGYRCFTRDGRP